MAQPYDLANNGGDDPGGASFLGGIGGAIPGLNIFTPGIAAGMTATAASDARRAAAKNAAGIPLPQFSQDNFSAPDYAGDFTPGMYQTPEAAQYQTISTDPATRNMQMQALQQLMQRANGAADAQQAASQFHALDAANQMANAREGAIRQDMESRGQGGSALNAMMRAQAAQMGANRGQAGSLDAQSQAALQKLAALGQEGQMAGAIRGQDFQNAAANAGIINQFNALNTQARNAANQHNIDTTNYAGMYNQGNRQNILNARAGAHNASLSRDDQNRQTMYGDYAGRTGMVNNALTGMATGATQAGQDAISAGKTGYSNFKDLMSMFGGMGGMGGAG